MSVYPPTAIHLFDGIGGFPLGLQRAGWRSLWANDIDKYACQIHRKNLKGIELVEGDIREIKPETIPDATLLTAGFPCQSFSLAGKREGFRDIRGTMFYEVIRIAEAKRPALLLLENVKGLLSNDGGKTFGTILEKLGSIGYWVEWQTLNSKHFGVPQNRERVFIIGHLRERNTRQIFPIKSDGREDYEVGEVAGTLQGGGHSGGLHSNMTAILADNLGGNIKQRERDANKNPSWSLGGSKTVIMQEHSFSGENGKGRGIRLFEGTCPTLATQMGTGGNNVPMVAQALQTDGFLRSGSSFGTTNPQSSRNIRRLTPTECERLQGFPDGWTEGVSDTQRYKLLGNAVTVNVIEFLGERILENITI